MDILKTIARELSLPDAKVAAAVQLLDDGNTVPFIARYRKEVTGGLDDEQLRKLTERLTYLRGLEKRKEEVRALLTGLDKLTPELSRAIDDALTMTEVEDIYRPYRPKRRTRASIARERGLEPFAALLLLQNREYHPALAEEAEKYVNPEKDVPDTNAVFAGANDILAEDFADRADIRQALRDLLWKQGEIVTKKAADMPVYEQYYDAREKLSAIPSHRVLAINRGEAEGALKVTLELDRARGLSILSEKLITNRRSPAYPYINDAIADSYDRLLYPSVEREVRNLLTEKAEDGAIHVFADNLRHLLLQSPLKGKTVLGYDPGYRTGCKLAVVDKTGAVQETAVIYPTKPHEKIRESRETVLRLIREYSVDVVSIGNGTASGESEQFIADVIRETPGVKYTIVSEAGASVYSASKLGAEEFPDFDVTERSAVSIARRLQDPLAELVKIEPRSIGVGQYQHDMNAGRLNETLGGVVEDCVNAVGVDLNTASAPLLSYIAGINGTCAKNIVKYREENGEFASRSAVKKVPRFGAKAYEQAAGFLRIPGGREPLDNTGVHPESYAAAKTICETLGYPMASLRSGGLSGIREKAQSYGISRLAADAGVGEATLADILTELEKPGRDIREELSAPVLREKVLTMEELQPGDIFDGVVRNVVDFGAFVDIGVHEDGLVHISQIADKFIKHPSQVLSVGDRVRVAVLSVDLARKRLSLTMKGIPKADGAI